MNPLLSALNCNKSIFIQACAGAGKTFALTKRYAAILNSFAQEAEKGAPIELIDPKKILVITFTKKAASEMKERIYKDVSLLLSGKVIEDIDKQIPGFGETLRKEGNEALENYKKDLKMNFSQNAISTIDSFCAGILREFAYKLGLDPQFLSQDDHDANRLLNESLDAWISEKLKNNTSSFDTLLEEFSFYQIKEILKNMYASREVLDEYLMEFESKKDDEIWQDWLKRYTPDVQLDDLILAFESLWKNAQSLCENKKDALFIGIQDMYKELSRLNISEPLEYRATVISEIIRKSAFLTQKGTYRKKPKGAKGNWSDKKEQAQIWYDLLQNTLDEEEISLTPSPIDKKIIPLLKYLIVYYGEFNAYYLNIRMDSDVLDFSDVIILTHKLLSEHKDVRNLLGKRYRHIMLDEFQDTNPLRWEIIKMILDAGQNIKLFIVGDRKQSIYRFNNADVTVMNTAEELVRSIGGETLNFNDNYRSSREFIDEAINALMGGIMKKPDEDKEPYEADFLETSSPIDKTGISPAIEKIWCESDMEEEDYLPAYHTAWQVKRLLAEHENTEIDPGKDKALIAILLRRNTKLSEYLQAFTKLGIPVSILGGKDFYLSPALKDIFYLISVLDNPHDDHALVGLLRSPFFALSDPHIHLLSKRKNLSVFDAMSSIPEFQNAYHNILFWQQASKTQAIDELIAEILDKDDRELGYVSELMPEQQLANFDKALNIIRAQQRHGSTLRDIRKFLYYQIQVQADESQAEYSAKTRVHIMTVHKAKGLEYPIVIIPEMNQKGAHDKNKFRYGRYNELPEISLSLNEDEKPGLLLRLKNITKREEEAEEKRVFYVAVTRAKYKVLLLGEGKKATANTWWSKYILELGDDAGEDDFTIEKWDKDIEIIKKEKVLAGNTDLSQESLSWKEKTRYSEPGKYIYSSPHDLMGEKQEFDFEESRTGLGTAPGKLYHYCMEKSWLNIDEHIKEINEHILQAYPLVDGKKLLAKVKPWLVSTSKHKLAEILQDPEIEKYPELNIKAWLSNDKDVVQVNGIIDLLYRDGESWTILDYKTDASKRLFPSYTKQLQTYQWMLKQIYGIEARAQIYFVSLNEVLEIKWQESYFDELALGLELKAQLPPSAMNIEKLIPKLKKGKELILCASAQHEEQVYLALAKEGVLTPDIKVSTLSKFLHEDREIILSQNRLRLMIKHYHTNMKNGTADHLARALRNEELAKGQVKEEFKVFYKGINDQADYVSADQIYNNVSAKDQRIILLDLHVQTDLEQKVLDKLKSETDLIELSLIDEKPAEEYILIEAFSPREEVLAVAKHIKENVAADEQVMIAVASMEKYAPHLQRQLPKLGLKARFIGPRSLYEFPCTALLMDYLQLNNKINPAWKDLSAVLLHPLMKASTELYLYDRSIRKYPLEERDLPQQALDFIGNLGKNINEVLDKTSKFIKRIKTDQDVDMCKACDKFLDLLEATIEDLSWVGHIDMSAITHEIGLRIRKEGIPRRDQWNGIPVVGLLDSLGVYANKLYVLGMVEGDIPRQEGDNPFFIKNKDYSLALNYHFMDEWLKLGENVIFATSTHAEEGAEQNRSSFLEEIKLKIIDNEIQTRREDLLVYRDKKIKDHDSVLIERHHEILDGKRATFSGDVLEKQNSFELSVTQVDTLLACPMKFYFDRVIKCSPMDQEEAPYWGSKKGNVVHKAYEFFIEGQGYSLDMEEALNLMYDCLDRALDVEKIDKDDPIEMDHFRHYVKNFALESEKNSLIRNLDLIDKKYSEYTEFKSEKAFNDLQFVHPDLEINLRGRIDKIMINQGEKKLIASDFKTGSITSSLLSKMMLSQLYLYLKYCQREYPDYELQAIYELMKEPNKKGTKIIELKINADEIKLGQSKLSAEKFEEHLRDLFSQIADGKYYITEKAFKDACKYCAYEGLCRKETRLKETVNDKYLRPNTQNVNYET